MVTALQLYVSAALIFVSASESLPRKLLRIVAGGSDRQKSVSAEDMIGRVKMHGRELIDNVPSNAGVNAHVVKTLLNFACILEYTSLIGLG